MQIKRLEHAEGLPLPSYATEGSAGMDLCSAIDYRLAPGCHKAIPTGFCFSIPEDFEGQVRPRSGLAYKHGVTVLNSPGTIDSDYRGEVHVMLINHGKETFDIKRGDRIGQIVFALVSKPIHGLIEVDELDETVRGDGKFGSTGV